MGLLDALAGASQGVASGLQGWNAATYKNAELDERRRHQQMQEDLTRQQRELQQQDFNWRKSEADSKRMLDSQRTLATMWYLNGGPDVDPTGSKFTKERGFNPFEHVSPDIVSRMQDRAEQRDLQRQLAQDRNDTMRAIASMRMDSRGQGQNFVATTILGEDGRPKRVMVDKNNPMAAPIVLGDAESAVKIDTAAAKSSAAQDAAARQANLVGEDIGRAMEMASGVSIPITGIAGRVMSNIPGTTAHDLAKTLDSVKANTAFKKLQEMRQNSPTGGALGSVSDNDMLLLKAVEGSLEQSQSKEQLLYNLDRLRSTTLDIVHGPGNWSVGEGGRISVGAGGGKSMTSKQQKVSVPNQGAAQRKTSAGDHAQMLLDEVRGGGQSITNNDPLGLR